MKISFITPTAYIREYQSQSDFILALSHLIDLDSENQYEKAIRETGLPIILDNGLYENGIPEPVESLVKKAKKIGATTAFCPDYLYDAEATRDEIDTAYPIFQEAGIKMAAIVQSDNEDEWLRLYDQFVLDDRISLIGLSILSIRKAFSSNYGGVGGSIVGARIKCLEKLLMRPSKTCHLLGAGEGYEDILYAHKNCSFVESHDSSSAFWNAMQGKKLVELMTGSIRVEGGKTEVPVDFSFNSATSEQLERAQQNINLLKSRLK